MLRKAIQPIGEIRSEIKSAIPKLNGDDIEWIIAIIQTDRDYFRKIAEERDRLQGRIEQLEKAHEEMHKYLTEIGDSNCELCEALERAAVGER